jgi:large subunit ribosomal protein L21
MYVVFEDGSRQYKVSEGQVVRVDYRDVEVGTRVEFNKVLLYQNADDTRIGQPVLEGLRVVGDVVEHPSVKVMIQHFRRRKNYRRLRGHRQYYTAVRVQHILLPGQQPPAAPPPAAASPAPEATQTPAPESTPATPSSNPPAGS